MPPLAIASSDCDHDRRGSWRRRCGRTTQQQPRAPSFAGTSGPCRIRPAPGRRRAPASRRRARSTLDPGTRSPAAGWDRRLRDRVGDLLGLLEDVGRADAATRRATASRSCDERRHAVARSTVGSRCRAKNGSTVGGRKTVMGQPPRPVMPAPHPCRSASMSGRSSRSTFTLTKSWFMIAAVGPSSNDSWAMTWHQ